MSTYYKINHLMTYICAVAESVQYGKNPNLDIGQMFAHLLQVDSNNKYIQEIFSDNSIYSK